MTTIRLPITPEQARQARSGYIDLSRDQALSVRGKVTSQSGGGRPPKLAPCKHCGEMMGTAARRAHEPRCEQK